MPSLIAKSQASPSTMPKTAAVVSANQTLGVVGGNLTTPPNPAGVKYDGGYIVADAASASSAANAKKTAYTTMPGYQNAANALNPSTSPPYLIQWGFPSNVQASQWGYWYACANFYENGQWYSHYTYYFFPTQSGLTTTTVDTNAFANAVVTQAATDSVLDAELENAVTAGITQSANAAALPTVTTYPLTATGPAVFTDNPADATAPITTYPAFTPLANTATSNPSLSISDVTTAITSALGLTSVPPDTVANSYDTSVAAPTASPISTLFDFIVANSPLLSLGSRIHITTSNASCKVSGTVNLAATGNAKLRGSLSKEIDLDFCQWQDTFTWLGTMFVALAHCYAAFILLGRRENA